MRSGVAGETSDSVSVTPWSARALLRASLMAKNTAEPIKSGGLRWVFGLVTTTRSKDMEDEINSLANSSAALNGVQILPCHALEHANVEDLRDVSETRDLIVARPASEDLTVATKPERFLSREKTLALDKRSFDLAVIDGGVDGAADILCLW
jgi:hypothetical protein